MGKEEGKAPLPQSEYPPREGRDSVFRAHLPLLQQESLNWAQPGLRLQGMLGALLWEATGLRELILRQDMSLGRGALVLYPVSTGPGCLWPCSGHPSGTQRVWVPGGGSEGEGGSRVRSKRLLAPTRQYPNPKVRVQEMGSAFEVLGKRG